MDETACPDARISAFIRVGATSVASFQVDQIGEMDETAG